MKNFKISTILSDFLPYAAVRLGSTSATAPDFSLKKGNRV